MVFELMKGGAVVFATNSWEQMRSKLVELSLIIEYSDNSFGYWGCNDRYSIVRRD